jgi:hypothetical protein
MKLNQKTAAAIELPAGKLEAIVYDEDLPGFGVRIRAGGSRKWVVSYRIGRKDRRITLGSIQALDAGKARNRAKEILAQVRLGQDPAGSKAEGIAVEFSARNQVEGINEGATMPPVNP